MTSERYYNNQIDKLIFSLEYKEVTNIINMKTCKNGTGYVIDAHGNKKVYKNWQLHNENGPAIEFKNGDKEWYIDGQRHREDGPAVICTGGSIIYYNHDSIHREDGPAVIWADGNEAYYVNNDYLEKKDYWQRLHKIGKISKEELFKKLL